MNRIPIIDIFAGPGGLAEGFSSVGHGIGKPCFKIALSIEKDPNAHRTLELRSFVRQFPYDRLPDEYYQYLRGEISREDLFGNSDCREEAALAREEAWHTTLGTTRGAKDAELASIEEVYRRIQKALRGADNWVLIGGPPCQAYSLVGRSRSGGIDPDDHRAYLYREYLRILALHSPPVFVMENVKGLLSARVRETSVFRMILDDLRSPAHHVSVPEALRGKVSENSYTIFSLVKRAGSRNLFQPLEFQPGDYIIRSEQYGIPQARHRVILLGIRNDFCKRAPEILDETGPVTVKDVLSGLPRLRSGISKGPDGKKEWSDTLEKALDWLPEVEKCGGAQVSKLLQRTIATIHIPRSGRGGEFLEEKPASEYQKDWYVDPRLQGYCNSSTRSHIAEDLQRYLYAACFTQIHKKSPQLKDFPQRLRPKHKNIDRALEGSLFSDRFRVQRWNAPSSTITSHISKDGHYYIHPDPSQCRSLTVREAARLQTFPDNYFFEGPRTEQYRQVGNAVPPLLASRIAEVVSKLF